MSLVSESKNWCLTLVATAFVLSMATSPAESALLTVATDGDASRIQAASIELTTLDYLSSTVGNRGEPQAFLEEGAGASRSSDPGVTNRSGYLGEQLMIDALCLPTHDGAGASSSPERQSDQVSGVLSTLALLDLQPAKGCCVSPNLVFPPSTPLSLFRPPQDEISLV